MKQLPTEVEQAAQHLNVVSGRWNKDHQELDELRGKLAAIDQVLTNLDAEHDQGALKLACGEHFDVASVLSRKAHAKTHRTGLERRIEQKQVAMQPLDLELQEASANHRRFVLAAELVEAE